MKLFRDYFKRKPAEPQTTDDTGSAEKKSLIDLQAMKDKLRKIVTSKKRSRTQNALLVVTGAGIAAVGIAADMAFLGGVGTVTVISCLYSDLRNAQHIKKISDELGKIDEKIDDLTKQSQPVPDYAPALSAVKSSIEQFQASAKKLPPDVSEELAKLNRQVEALQVKIAPQAKP